MGCSSCNTGSGAIGGCQNNGNCGTGGCNRLNVYDWLSDMSLPSGQAPFNVMEVRFKGTRKEYYKNVNDLQLRPGDIVAVEASPGHDVGVISLTGELVRLQMRKKNIDEHSAGLKAIYRKAKDSEVEKWESVKAKETDTMLRTRKIAGSLKLAMKISDVEYQGDGKKATFFYTADDRVDFRQLIVKMAEEFKVRIEMKQIGMRQEAGRLGGIGSCGRELCCSTWLTDFRTVTTHAARYQNLSLNPLKLAGQCGKLKCCLNYELDIYLDAFKQLPDSTIRLETQKGFAYHRKTDIFKQIMWYSYSDRDTQSDFIYSDINSWIALDAKQVSQIIDLNKSNIKPPDLVGAQIAEKPKPQVFEFTNAAGEDSLTRMDRPNKNKNRNNRRNEKRSN